MWANQTGVVQPRLIPSQLPWGLKQSSSNSGMPIVSLWANKIGISSTRSVVTINGSVISTAYRIFKILSPFDRTMSELLVKCVIASLAGYFCSRYEAGLKFLVRHDADAGYGVRGSSASPWRVIHPWGWTCQRRILHPRIPQNEVSIAPTPPTK